MNLKLPPSLPKIIGGISLLVIVFALGVTVSQVQRQQDIRQRATGQQWLTDQSAETACPTDNSGVQIKVSFSNTEPPGDVYAMKVTATDERTTRTTDLGTINPGQTKNGVINTGRATVQAGNVSFKLTWADGHPGEDSRTASYQAAGPCASPSPTKEPTSTPSVSITMTPSPTQKPSTTPSPSSTPCPTPGTANNVRVECPYCPPATPTPKL